MLLIVFEKYVYSSKYEDFSMIVRVSKKINVFLLLVVAMNGSLVFGMDDDNSKDKSRSGSPAPQSVKGWSFARVQQSINGFLPSKGKVLEYQAKILPVFVGAGFGLGGLFLSQKNNKSDDVKWLSLLATTTLLAAGATSSVAQGFTPQGQYDACKKTFKEIEDDSLLKDLADVDFKDEKAVNTHINGAILHKETYVLDVAKERLYDLEKKGQTLKVMLQGLDRLDGFSAPIKNMDEQGEVIKAFKDGNQATGSLLKKLDGLMASIKQLNNAVINRAATSGESMNKAAGTQKQQLIASQSWRATALACLPSLTSFFNVFSSYFLMTTVFMAASSNNK